MKRRVTVVLFIFILFCGGFVAADYFSVFGIKKFETSRYIKVNFHTIDGRSGARVPGVKVRCVQKNVANACAQRGSEKRGTVSILIPAKLSTTRSYLFLQSEEFIMPPQPDFHIMFVHPEYGSTFESFQVMDLLTRPDEERVVKLGDSPEPRATSH